MTTIGTCVPNHSSATRRMWGGLTSGGFGGQAGIVLFGVNLGGSSARHRPWPCRPRQGWTIHNPTHSVYFPSVSMIDDGQALAAYTVSGSAHYASAAYSTFTTSVRLRPRSRSRTGVWACRTASATTRSTSTVAGLAGATTLEPRRWGTRSTSRPSTSRTRTARCSSSSLTAPVACPRGTRCSRTSRRGWRTPTSAPSTSTGVRHSTRRLWHRTTRRSGTTPLTAKVGGRRGESPAALFV